MKQELIDWESFVEHFGPVFRDGVGDEQHTDVFPHNDKGDERWEDFRKRVVEHVGCSVMMCLVCLCCEGGLVYFAKRQRIACMQIRKALSDSFPCCIS